MRLISSLNHLMRPEVIAKISDQVYYANGNKASTPLVSETIRNNPAIYPAGRCVSPNCSP